MLRLSQPVLATTAAIIATFAFSLGPLAVAASEGAPRTLAAVDVRNQFAHCGFELPNPRIATSNTAYFSVRDPGTNWRDNNRVLMVLVYASDGAATTAHQKAHDQAEASQTVRRQFSDDNGPQLLGAYGGSVWRDNVALVQSSSFTLNSLYYEDSQTGEGGVARPELLVLGFAPVYAGYAVDADFVYCLEETPTAPPSAPVMPPVFVPGRPF